jgi:hypothetical protein
MIGKQLSSHKIFKNGLEVAAGSINFVSLCLNHEQRLGIGSGQCTQTFFGNLLQSYFFRFLSLREPKCEGNKKGNQS